MKRALIIVFTLIAVVIVLAIVLYLDPARASLEGAWSIEFQNPLFGQSKATLWLTEDEDTLNGRLVSSLGATYIVVGERFGKNFELKAFLSFLEGRSITMRGRITRHRSVWVLEGEWASNTNLAIFGFSVNLGNSGTWRGQRTSSGK